MVRISMRQVVSWLCKLGRRNRKPIPNGPFPNVPTPTIITRKERDLSFIDSTLSDSGSLLIFNTPPYAVSPPNLISLNIDKELPVELILHFFSCLPIKSLIASRGVCKGWRRLVPLADLNPNRRRLLQLFDTIINSPFFLRTRPWTVNNLQDFDRQAYVDALLEQYDKIPEEFRLWILEWPARVAVRCQWPGLPFVDCRGENIEREKGINFLANVPPQLSALIYKDADSVVKHIPGLLIWRADFGTTWLIFDDKCSLCGGVVRFLDAAIIPRLNDKGDLCSLDDNDVCFHRDWITYQTFAWNTFESSRGSHGTVIRHDDLPVSRTNDVFNNGSHHDVPAPPWTRRHEPQYLQRLSDSVSFQCCLHCLNRGTDSTDHLLDLGTDHYCTILARLCDL